MSNMTRNHKDNVFCMLYRGRNKMIAESIGYTVEEVEKIRKQFEI